MSVFTLSVRSPSTALARGREPGWRSRILPRARDAAVCAMLLVAASGCGGRAHRPLDGGADGSPCQTPDCSVPDGGLDAPDGGWCNDSYCSVGGHDDCCGSCSESPEDCPVQAPYCCGVAFGSSCYREPWDPIQLEGSQFSCAERPDPDTSEMFDCAFEGEFHPEVCPNDLPFCCLLAEAGEFFCVDHPLFGRNCYPRN